MFQDGVRGRNLADSEYFRWSMDRQPDEKRRSFVFAVADGSDGPVVKLRQLANNREPEPESSMVSRCRRVCLPKSIENKWEEFGLNANSRI
jgi:hypothetical protein